MPLYEYRCDSCERRFELLRSFGEADSVALCPYCAAPSGRRMISLFAAVSRDAGGGSRLVAGSSTASCGSCAGGHCATCGH